MGTVMANLLSQVGPIFCLSFLGLVSFTGLAEAKLGKSLNRNINDWFDSNIRLKRDNPDPELARYEAMQNADDTLSRLSRPRFGKRDTPEPELTRYEAMQNADDTLPRLSRPRFGKRGTPEPELARYLAMQIGKRIDMLNQDDDYSLSDGQNHP